MKLTLYIQHIIVYDLRCFVYRRPSNHLSEVDVTCRAFVALCDNDDPRGHDRDSRASPTKTLYQPGL